MDVLKTIVPAAGQGTRFFPYTKSVPKEINLMRVFITSKVQRIQSV